MYSLLDFLCWPLYQDPEKTPTAVGFQPFSAAHAEEEEKDGNVKKQKLTWRSFINYLK